MTISNSRTTDWSSNLLLKEAGMVTWNFFFDLNLWHLVTQLAGQKFSLWDQHIMRFPTAGSAKRIDVVISLLLLRSSNL